MLLKKMIVIILTKDNGDDSEDRHKNNTDKNVDANDNIFWKEYLTQRQDYDLINGKRKKNRVQKVLVRRNKTVGREGGKV